MNSFLYCALVYLRQTRLKTGNIPWRLEHPNIRYCGTKWLKRATGNCVLLRRNRGLCSGMYLLIQGTPYHVHLSNKSQSIYHHQNFQYTIKKNSRSKISYRNFLRHVILYNLLTMQSVCEDSYVYRYVGITPFMSVYVYNTQ